MGRGITKLILNTTILEPKWKVYTRKLDSLKTKVSIITREIIEKEQTLKRIKKNNNTSIENIEVLDNKIKALYKQKESFATDIKLFNENIQLINKRELIKIKNDVLVEKATNKRQPKNLMWTTNIDVTHTTPIRMIMAKQLSFHQMMLNMSENVKVFKIKAFEHNGTMIDINNIYPANKEYMCIFGIDNSRLSLMTLGSKTLSELTSVGYDSKNKSTVPLLMYKDIIDNQLVLKSINLIY